MNQILIIYESKYGTTKEATNNIAKILGSAIVIKPSEFSEGEYEGIKSILMITPVFSEKIPKSMDALLREKKDWFQKRKVAFLAVCTGPNAAARYFEDYTQLLGASVVWAGGIGGMIDPDILDEADYEAIRRFSNIVRIPFRKRDNRDITDLAKKALEIRTCLENECILSKQEARKAIDAFIEQRNTATLCSGYEVQVRATPLEYFYFNGLFYFFSEGGEKFANIFINENVAIAIYDAFTGFETLAGMQIAGKAQIIEPDSNEYKQVAQKRGIHAESTAASLHLIRVRPIRFEMICSETLKDEKIILNV